ncbi:hypothetical protein SUDANB126_06315 [Streptomyces sp. enrichment culture]
MQTWDGDGLDTFLASLAEDFRGREGVRTWHSLCCDLTLSAEHRPGGHVQLTWGIHDRAPSEEWHSATTTVHAAGEDVRNLAAEIHTLIASVAKWPKGPQGGAPPREMTSQGKGPGPIMIRGL